MFTFVPANNILNGTSRKKYSLSKCDAVYHRFAFTLKGLFNPYEMENPFELIDKKLSNIERLLQELKSPAPAPEPPDRCGLSEAIEIIGSLKSGRPALF